MGVETRPSDLSILLTMKLPMTVVSIALLSAVPLFISSYILMGKEDKKDRKSGIHIQLAVWFLMLIRSIALFIYTLPQYAGDLPVFGKDDFISFGISMGISLVAFLFEIGLYLLSVKFYKKKPVHNISFIISRVIGLYTAIAIPSYIGDFICSLIVF